MATPFGQGRLYATFGPPDGPDIETGPLRFVRVRGEYVTDDFSTALVEIEGTCCEILPMLRPLYHELRIWRDSRPVWWGPIPPSGITTTADRTIVEAVDRSFWALNSRSPESVEYVDAQPESVAVELWNHMGVDGYGYTRPIVTTNTNARAQLDVRQGEETFRPLEELARDYVDWSTIGNVTYIGAPHIEPDVGPLMLSDPLLASPAGRGWSGDGFTTASALSRVDGVDTETLATTGVDVPWELHTSVVINDSSDPAGVAGALVQQPEPRRALTVDGAVLSDKVDGQLSELIPGRVVSVTSDCDPGRPQEQIIQSVSFDWESQPGTTDAVETISIGTRTPVAEWSS